MKILQPPQFDEPSSCPYLPERQKRYRFFLASELSAGDLGRLLAEGWRKFGPYFFRPECDGCRLCIPLRVPTASFLPSRSQRRVLKKGAGLRVVFGPLRPSQRVLEIYREHSRERFGEEATAEEFLCNFYLPSCPGLQSEFYLGEKLVGVGILDRGADCLSSVYFCYDPLYSHLNLGIYSVLAEIGHAARLGLPYYYLGYYVPGCARMTYKSRFGPRERFDWEGEFWRPDSPNKSD